MANRHKKLAPKDEGQEINLYVFSNNVKDEGAYQLLQMFYRGAFDNQIGISRMKNTETDEEELVLCGVETVDGKPRLYPLSVVLNPTTVAKYVSPDGLGGWFEPTQASVTEH